jgi:phosphoglycolate phosphatase
MAHPVAAMSSLTKKINVDLIVFDLDGTLADSLADLTNAANHACRRLNLPEHAPGAVKSMIGGGERKFVERVVGPENQGLVAECLQLYLDYYWEHCGDLTRLYPGVAATLRKLAGKKLAVLSNKRQDLTEKILGLLGVASYFAATRGGGRGLPLKPSAAPLKALIRDLRVEPARVLMVGDKTADVTAGREAGAFTAAVTYGYGAPAALTAAAPDFVLRKFSQVADILS